MRREEKRLSSVHDCTTQPRLALRRSSPDSVWNCTAQLLFGCLSGSLPCPGLRSAPGCIPSHQNLQCTEESLKKTKALPKASILSGCFGAWCRKLRHG
ncbi:unnamed protein product [Prunus armeniaca]